MEVNARLWGSLQLAIDAGLDFPVALAEFGLGRPITVGGAFHGGVRTVWEFGELDHAIALFSKSREELHLPASSEIGFQAALRAILDHRWSDRLEILRWNDPFPFMIEIVRWISRR
jgi:hypothetical protein